MGNIAKRPDGRWRARYRDNANKEHARHFDRKIDAQRWLDSVTTAVQTGLYIDPSKGKVTIADWAKRWFDGQAHLKPSTRERYAGILREHVLPRWSNAQLIEVTHADIQAWVSALTATRSPATVRKIHRVLALVLKAAVKDGRLARNPAAEINLPRPTSSEHRYLTHEQVDALAKECATPPAERSKHGPGEDTWNDDYRLVILFLAYTGCRWGEMTALRVGNVDFLRRRARLVEAVTLVRGVQTWGTLKGHERREVPLPPFLVEELATHVIGKQPEELFFTATKGGPLRSQVFQRAVLTRAAASAGLDHFHPHELRHTAASLAIASGADIKVVQQMLGHKSATMTLDLYGHLFEHRLDEVATATDAARSRGLLADSLRTDGKLINLSTYNDGSAAQ
jgi:integrase